MRDPAADGPLEQAVKRLDRAISLLEQRLAGGAKAPGGLFDHDASKLEAELAQSRLREKELEEAGAEASAALGRAIAEIKSALAGAPAQSEPETEEA
jgi:hypothetical protein